MVLEIWCAMDEWTDRQTDEQKKWHIEVGAPPKKNETLESWIGYWVIGAGC